MTDRCARLTQALFLAGIVSLVAGLSFGLHAWLTRIRDVPEEVMTKLRWELREDSVDDVGPIYIDLYNGSEWTIKDVTVELTAGREKRRYRTWSEGTHSPLSNSAIGFRPDSAFRRRWIRGGSTLVELFGDAPPRTHQWHIVSATGRPGG